MKDVALWIRGALTLVLLALTAWWLLKVSTTLDASPIKDSDGNVVDSYQRAKDILLAVLPLLTLALGYWFGSAGKEKSDAKADAAQTRLTAVMDAGEPGLLQRARQLNPKAFGEKEEK